MLTNCYILYYLAKYFAWNNGYTVELDKLASLAEGDG